MNLRLKTSLLPKQDSSVTESSCRQSRPDRSSIASCGCVHVPCTILPLQVGQFRVFCESVPRQILILRLLAIPGAARSTRVLQFEKISGAYHTSFNHQRSTNRPTQAQKCVQTNWRDEMARTRKHIFRHEHFRQQESITLRPKSIFPLKLKLTNVMLA